MRAADTNLFAERRARSDAPYLWYIDISLSWYWQFPRRRARLPVDQHPGMNQVNTPFLDLAR